MSKLKLYFDVSDEGIKLFRLEKDNLVIDEVNPHNDETITMSSLITYKGEPIIMVYCEDGGRVIMSVVESKITEVYEEGGFLVGDETQLDESVFVDYELD